MLVDFGGQNRSGFSPISSRFNRSSSSSNKQCFEDRTRQEPYRLKLQSFGFPYVYSPNPVLSPKPVNTAYQKSVHSLLSICYDSLNLELEHIVEPRTAPEEPGMAQMSPNAI